MKKKILSLTALLTMSFNTFAICENATTEQALRDCYLSKSPQEIWMVALSSHKQFQTIGKYCRVGDNSKINQFACDYYVKGKSTDRNDSVGLSTETSNTGCLKNGDLSGVHNRQTCWTSSNQDNLSILDGMTDHPYLSENSACTNDGKLNAYRLLMSGVLDTEKDPCGIKELADERAETVTAVTGTGAIFDIKSDDRFYFQVVGSQIQKEQCFYKFDIPRDIVNSAGEKFPNEFSLVKMSARTCKTRVDYTKGGDGGILNLSTRIGGNLDTIFNQIASVHDGLTKAEVKAEFVKTEEQLLQAAAMEASNLASLEDQGVEFDYSPEVNDYISGIQGDVLEVLITQIETKPANDPNIDKIIHAIFELTEKNPTILLNKATGTKLTQGKLEFINSKVSALNLVTKFDSRRVMKVQFFTDLRANMKRGLASKVTKGGNGSGVTKGGKLLNK